VNAATGERRPSAAGTGRGVARRIAVLLCLAAAAGPSQAEGLGGFLRQGMEKVGQGAQAVGQGATAIGNQIDDRIRSTESLVRNGDDPAAKRAELDAMASAAIGRLFVDEPGAMELFLLSAGYAVFDTRRVVVVGVAAGGGKGVAIARDGSRRVYMNMGTAGVGMSFGLGGFETQQVILFESDWDFETFLRNGFDARAEAGTMVGRDKASLGMGFVDGRATYALTAEGWKVSATATGTRYWADAELNAPAPLR
jgi:hypothetical protein